MGAAAPVHPNDQTIQSFGLGKLDDALAASIQRHLESCTDCRRRVAEVTSDSFLGRLSAAEGRADSSGPLVTTDTCLSTLAANASSTASSLADTIPGGLVNHPDYEVIRELGQGGMGTVYLAKNRLMGRLEVLKVVSSHLIKRRGVMDRFLSEIRNAARLHHSNIVTAYSASRLGESIIFAMEYVDGLDLAKLVKAKGPFAVAHACNYVYQAALGLQHAHEHGMVHRDIKPSNLILAPQGGRAVIKVLDFGLAKIQSEGAVDGGLTHDGQMLGTPDFVAPEQIGDARRADIRADIYSLGCTIYYLLTGGPPFKATSLYEILQAHHSMDALPLNLVRPDVPVKLAALVARMMAKDPELRFQTPNEVAQALKPFFKPASFGSVKPELSFPGSPDVVGDLRAPALPPATNKPDHLPASRPAVAVPGAGSVWERLIDLGEPDPLSDAPPVIAATARPTRPWPMVIGVSIVAILVVTALAWLVGHMTTTDDQNVSVALRAENRVLQSPNTKSPGVTLKDETSGFTQTDASFGGPTPVSPRDPFPSSSANADNRFERAPSTVEQKSSSNTPAQSTSQVKAETPEQAAQKPRTESPVSVAEVLSPDERLQQFGLKRTGRIYFLTRETDVERRFNEFRSTLEEFRTNAQKKAANETGLATMKELEQANSKRNLWIDQLNQELSKQPPRPDNQVKATFDAMRAERDQHELDRSAASFLWKELQGQLLGPREMYEINVAIERGRVSCRSALDELGELIKTTDAKIRGLKTNDQVKKALADLKDLRLDHSSGYQNTVKQIRQWDVFVKSTTERTEPKAEPVAKKKSSMPKR
ncbi:MAG TPA: protein kinase [Isosphaeraceae bacterium]|nr:protein kinase [Isosphaeraceae bacterium]